MVQLREAPIKDFVTVRHDGTAVNFLMHRDEVGKLNTPAKVGVYELPFKQYFAPDEKFTKGRYTAKSRVFVASFLRLVSDTPQLDSAGDAKK